MITDIEGTQQQAQPYASMAQPAVMPQQQARHAQNASHPGDAVGDAVSDAVGDVVDDMIGNSVGDVMGNVIDDQPEGIVQAKERGYGNSVSGDALNTQDASAHGRQASQQPDQPRAMKALWEATKATHLQLHATYAASSSSTATST